MDAIGVEVEERGRMEEWDGVSLEVENFFIKSLHSSTN